MKKTVDDIRKDLDTRGEQTLVVQKDNRLIQNLIRRKYELSVTEQKILCYILSKIDHSAKGDIVEYPVYTYSFNIRQFCRVCGINYDSGANYQGIKAALDKLADNSFWLDYGEGEFRFQWITTPDIQKRNGVVEIEIPRKVMPYLYNLSEKYTSYQLFNILALKSSYSIMLYELFKSWAYKEIFTVDISALRDYLSIGDDKYKEYRDFRRVVLEKSIKEIEEYTDIRVKFRGIRNGRSYSKIEFSVKVLKDEDIEGIEAKRRALAEINGVKYKRGQIHLFE